MSFDSVVFGFGHRARHGKDTVAAEIKAKRRHMYDIAITPFAGELKKEVNICALRSGGMRALFDDGLRVPGAGYMQANGDFIALPDWVQFDPNPDMSDPLCPLGKQRTMLQWGGTEYRRSIDPNYWVNKLEAALSGSKPEVALVTDMRFPNEMAWVQKYGEAIKVYRPNFKADVLPQASEESLANVPDAKWDAIILNDGTVEDLKRKALYTFDMLMERVQ